MNLETLILVFIETISTTTFQRRQILEYFSGKTDLNQLTMLIDEVCESSIVSQSPTVYDMVEFKKCMNTILPQLRNINVSDTSPTQIKNQPSVISTMHVADGRNDPNQTKVIKTKSYRELEELISPIYPLNIYISGETGLGKTTAVFEIGKKFNKPVIRVNMSGATDLDDLIGGIRIIDGNTVFDPGPVAISMELGCILLLDECDAGKPQVLIDLHPVLERKGVLAKKARKMIYPSPGFCVIATGNSKGVGDDTGKYIGVNTLNHAFLQRFGAAIEFCPPTRYEIEEIISSTLPSLPYSIIFNLCNWYDHVLTSYNAGGVTEYINPRKLIDIGTICLIFGCKNASDTSTINALRRGLSLYESSLVDSLIQLYDTILVDVDSPKEQEHEQKDKISEPSNKDEQGFSIPF